MTTQSLRGMANHGSMHWRGDRTGGNDPGGEPVRRGCRVQEVQRGLPGPDRPRQRADRRRHAGVHRLHPDRHLSAEPDPPPRQHAQRQRSRQGHDLFFGRITDTVFNCDGCHTLDPSPGCSAPSASPRSRARRRCSRSPTCATPTRRSACSAARSDATSQGPQVRGFGFLHDGSVDTVLHFLGAGVFSADQPGAEPTSSASCWRSTRTSRRSSGSRSP